MRYVLPEDYPSGNCVFLSVDIRLLPIIGARLSALLEPRLWVADGYQTGYRAITEVLAQMTALCSSNLIQEIRDFRGVKPEFESTPVDERTSDMYNSLNDSYAKLLELRGIMDDGWFSDTYTTLKDVVQVTRGLDQTNAVGMWDTVKDLIITSSSGASILTNIADLLSDVGETAVEGGLLTALIAIEASNAAIIQQQTLVQASMFTTLDNILRALRGETAPEDNILQAIRGDVEADADRNVVELLI